MTDKTLGELFENQAELRELCEATQKDLERMKQEDLERMKQVERYCQAIWNLQETVWKLEDQRNKLQTAQATLRRELSEQKRVADMARQESRRVENENRGLRVRIQELERGAQ